MFHNTSQILLTAYQMLNEQKVVTCENQFRRGLTTFYHCDE